MRLCHLWGKNSHPFNQAILRCLVKVGAWVCHLYGVSSGASDAPSGSSPISKKPFTSGGRNPRPDGCVCLIYPVRPDRPPDIVSHPMPLVSPNALMAPAIDPARLLLPPSVPTPPHPFPLLLLSSDGIRRTYPQFPAPGPPGPYLLHLAT